MRQTHDNENTVLSDDHLLWERAEWTHLPEFILVGYVNETLDAVDREIVEGHLSECSVCLAEARELRQLRTELTSRPQRITNPHRHPRWYLPTVIGGMATATAVILFIAITRPLYQQLSVQNKRVADMTERLQIAETRRNDAETIQRAQEKTLQTTREERDRLAHKLALRSALQSHPPVPTPKPTVIATPSAPSQIARITQPSLLPSGIYHLLTSPSLPLADMTALQATQTVLRGGEEVQSLTVIAPLATNLLSAQPIFHWQPLPDVHHYEVWVGDENDHIIARSPAIQQDTLWQPDHTLPRGKILTWEVYAFSSDGTQKAVSATIRFKVLPEPVAKHLTQECFHWRTTRPLVWAALAAKAGLRTDTENALMEILQSPDISAADYKIAQHWFAELRKTTHPSVVTRSIESLPIEGKKP